MSLSVANLVLVLTAISMVAGLIARTELRERRIGKIELEVYYIRRDLDQLLKLYRLTPIKEQERRRR